MARKGLSDYEPLAILQTRNYPCKNLDATGRDNTNCISPELEMIFAYSKNKIKESMGWSNKVIAGHRLDFGVYSRHNGLALEDF